MDDKNLKNRLGEIGQKIATMKAHQDFETRYNDGHKRTLAEMEQHYTDWHQKTEADLIAYEKEHGRINELERDLIVIIDAVKL